jgi:acyl carrier protein
MTDERRTEIFHNVATIAAEQGDVEPSRVTAETHLVNDLNFDSLQIVEFVMALEDQFRVAVPDEQARELLTVGQVVDHLVQLTDDAARDEAGG